MLNKLREAIEKKKYAVGTFLGAANPSIVEIMGYTGLDFVVIDTEHGPYDTMPMSDLTITVIYIPTDTPIIIPEIETPLGIGVGINVGESIE